MKDYNEMAKRIRALNEKWWVDLETGEPLNRNKGELIALMHSEVSEAFDGWTDNLMDDHLPHRKMVEVEMADAVIRILDYAGGFYMDLSRVKNEDNSFVSDTRDAFLIIHSAISGLLEAARKGQPEIEIIGDILILIEIFCHYLKLDLWGAVEEKLTYNQQRADHKHENRKQEGGKKF